MSTWGPTQIAATGDDASQDSSNFYGDGADGDGNYMLRDSGIDAHCGFRWDNVTVPAGATITSAVVEVFVGWAGGTYPRSVDWFCEDADDPAGFTGTGDGPRTRTKTTASARQTFDTMPTDEEWFSSPDIKDAVQEVIDRAGWASGQALIVITQEVASANSGCHQVRDYANSAVQSAKITIVYTTGSGPAPITLRVITSSRWR